MANTHKAPQSCNHGEASSTCPTCRSVIASEREDEFDLSQVPSTHSDLFTRMVRGEVDVYEYVYSIKARVRESILSSGPFNQTSAERMQELAFYWKDKAESLEEQYEDARRSNSALAEEVSKAALAVVGMQEQLETQPSVLLECGLRGERLLEQFGAVEGIADELDTILECYATGGFDSEAEFAIEVEGILRQLRGSTPAKSQQKGVSE